MASASEAEALNFMASLPSSRDGLLSVSRHLPGTEGATYGRLWRGKAAEFYRNLWGKKLGKLEALRQAQLTVLRDYDPGQGRLRGAGTPVALDAGGVARARQGLGAQANSLPPALWAGWVLSGDPGDLTRAGRTGPSAGVAPEPRGWGLLLGGCSAGLGLMAGLAAWRRRPGRF
jgi:hypothetical protein